MLQPGLRVRVDARPATPERIVGMIIEQTPGAITGFFIGADRWVRVFSSATN